MSHIIKHYQNIKEQYIHLQNIYHTDDDFIHLYRDLLNNCKNTVYIYCSDLVNLSNYIDLIIYKATFVTFYIKSNQDSTNCMELLNHSNIKINIIKDKFIDTETEHIKYILNKIDINKDLPCLYSILQLNYIMIDDEEFLLKNHCSISGKFQTSYEFRISKIELLFYTIWDNYQLINQLPLNYFISINSFHQYKDLCNNINNAKNYIYIENLILNLPHNHPLIISLSQRIRKAYLLQDDLKVVIIINRRIYNFCKSQQLAITCNNAVSLNNILEATKMSYEEFSKICSVMFLKRKNETILSINNVVTIDNNFMYILTKQFCENNFCLQIIHSYSINKVEQMLWKNYLNIKQKNNIININDIFKGYTILSSRLKKYFFISDLSVYKLITSSKSNFLKKLLKTSKINNIFQHFIE